MGTYINPEKGTKEDYLKEHGKEITREEFDAFAINDDTFAVILVDNGFFTAAWVADSLRELLEMKEPDPRPKKYYTVPKDKALAAIC